MAELSQEKCLAVNGDASPISDEEATQLLPRIPQWSLINEDGMRKLRREFVFNNFLQSLFFANTLGWQAEAEHHYPLTAIDRRKVTVTLWTNRLHDLHRNDFIMAAKADQIYLGMDLSKLTG